MDQARRFPLVATMTGETWNMCVASAGGGGDQEQEHPELTKRTPNWQRNLVISQEITDLFLHTYDYELLPATWCLQFG